jgi:hypothetical protein
VGDEELIADEMDVRLDAAVAAIEGIEQRMRMDVIVMRVGAEDGDGFTRGGG